jgi:threonine dehydratase
MLPTFQDVLDAAERLKGRAEETPLLRADALDEACGGRVFVKAEALQRTGSFKFRGAFNRLSRLSEAERRTGVVAFSSGNHAQGVAAAARIVGCPAVIVMPADAPAVKVEATRGYGAEVVVYDRYRESREAIAATIAAERGAVVVPAFDDPYIVAGQGTAGLEAARQLQARGAGLADVLLCPASGGGLMAGITLAYQRLSPSTKLYVCEPAGYADYAASLAAGRPTRVAPSEPSLCDSLMAPEPGAIPFAISGARLAGALAASDAQALDAMSFAYRHLKLVLEPGGAVAIAALLAGQLPLDGRTALVIASGGNVDPALYRRALALS